jgi:hypothetical protein
MNLRDIMMAKTLSSGGSGGGGGVSSWNDLTDKPFGEKIFVEILPETAFQIDSANGNTTIETSATLQEGKEYTVIFDNVEYNCTAYDSQGVIAVGNETIVGGTNGDNEPFVFADLNGAWMVIAQSVGSHTISVAQTGEKQLDEKYIPDTIARKDDVSWSSLKNKPFGPITGKMIRTVCDITVAAEDLKERSGAYQTDYIYAADFYLGDYTYEVIIDGVSYYTQAVDGYSNFDYLGSIDVLNHSNAEYPFLIYKDGIGFISVASYAPGPYTLKIVEYEGAYECKLIDEKYIPDTIARVSDVSGSGVSSWNDLTDKPFGEEGTAEIILPERTFNFTSAGYDSMEGYYYYYSYDLYINFVVGTEYVVTFDGVEYHCVADRTGGLGGKDLEMPVIISQGSMGAMYYYTKERGSHSISISTSAPIKQLDEKYIPDTIARVSDLGDIETALDNIIALQNNAIGGGA